MACIASIATNKHRNGAVRFELVGAPLARRVSTPSHIVHQNVNLVVCEGEGVEGVEGRFGGVCLGTR